MRKVLLLSLCLFVLPALALASAQTKNKKQKIIGQGSMHYFFWHIYDAKLYSVSGNFSFNRPFTLKLEYKRKFDGDKIADRSTEEIRKLGFEDEVKLAAWHAQMKKIFPDVGDGITLTGVYQPRQGTIFYKNNKKVGAIKDPAFGKWFFGIWLDKKTSEPTLRKALLGNKQ